MPNYQEKAFNRIRELFSCVENGAEMRQDLQFPLYFAQNFDCLLLLTLNGHFVGSQ